MIPPADSARPESDEISEGAPGIFSHALEMPPEARAAYLGTACAGDASLRAEVESLLRAHAEGAAFLQQPLKVTSPGEILTELLGGATAGTRVGPYRIVHLIAAGGMGAVYLAERIDEAFHKRVAIKLIRPGLWGSEVVQRFRHERQVLADLEHPSIARLIDGGSTAGDLPYLVMEYVDGIPINTYCEKHRLDVPARLDLFLAVCDAVQYAHQNLVIHRDLKPSNILVDRSGRVKLLDFGIAKVLGGDGTAPGEDLTVTAHQPLTPRYASPEQVTGHRMTTATDIYSLGVVLYEMLTASLPYELESKPLSEIVRTIADENPMRPSRRAALPASRHLAGDLDMILLKALQKDPARRYVTVEDFAADVRRHLQKLPVQARPDKVTYQLSRFVARHKVFVASLAAVMLLLLVTLGAMFAAHREAASRRHEAEWQAYVASLAAAESSLRADQVAEATDYLEGAPVHLRSWEWQHLHSRLDRSSTSFPAHSQGITRIAFLPDGKRFLTASIDSTLKVWEGSSGKLEHRYGPFTSEVESAIPVPGTELIAVGLNEGTVLLIDHAARTSRALQSAGSTWAILSASPDGSRLACGFFDGRVRVWSLPAGTILAEWKAHEGLSLPAYSPDGKLLATAGGEGTVHLYDAHSHAKLQELPAHERRVYSLAFSPDGSLLITGSIDRTATVWDVERRALVRTFREHVATVSAIAFDPRGDRVATAAGDNRLRIWSIGSGTVLGEFRGHLQDVSALAACPDGSGLLSGDWSGVVKLWEWGTEDVRTLRTSNDWIVARVYEAAWNPEETAVTCATNGGFLTEWSRSGLEVKPSPYAQAPVRRLLFSPDGAFLVTGNEAGEIVLYRASDKTKLRTVPAHRGFILGMAMHPDGKLLATASADSSVKLWRFPEVELVRSLAGHGGAVHDLEFSPTGDVLASSGADGTIRLWDPASGLSLGILNAGDGDVQDAAFDRPGRRLVSASRGGTVQIWDLKRQRPERILGRHGVKMYAVAWSHDGTRIATGGSDANVRLYDTASGREIMSLHGHVSGVTSLRFGRSDAFLTSTSADGTVRIWEGGHPPARTEILPSPAPVKRPMAAALATPR